MSDDRTAYVRNLIAARAPELSDDDIAALVAEPPDTLPVEIANQVLEVIEAMQDRLESLAESLRPPPPAKTVVGACRQAMVDLDVDAKALVVEELIGWVEAERGTSEPLH